MSFSGIVVRAAPECLAALSTELERLPGVNVHQHDAATGKLVLTLEASSVDEEIAGLARVQRVPGVVSADLVYHFLGDETAPENRNQPAPAAGTLRGES